MGLKFAEPPTGCPECPMSEDTTQMIALVLIIVTLSHVPLQAYEYDPYACYYQVKQKTDNRTIEHTNKFVEDGLDKAIEAANTRIARNSSYENCNENVLIVQVNDHVGGRFFSEIEEYAWEDMPERYRCEVNKKESIYNESGFNVLALLDWFTGNALHPMIRMCGVNFGIDKFGHFMGQGMEYYLRFRHYFYFLNVQGSLRLRRIEFNEFPVPGIADKLLDTL